MQCGWGESINKGCCHSQLLSVNTINLLLLTINPLWQMWNWNWKKKKILIGSAFCLYEQLKAVTCRPNYCPKLWGVSKLESTEISFHGLLCFCVVIVGADPLRMSLCCTKLMQVKQWKFILNLISSALMSRSGTSVYSAYCPNNVCTEGIPMSNKDKVHHGMDVEG